MESSDDSSKSFFKHVFNFDDDSKSEILNIIQYALDHIEEIEQDMNSTLKNRVNTGNYLFYWALSSSLEKCSFLSFGNNRL